VHWPLEIVGSGDAISESFSAVISSLLDWLETASTSPWFYLAIFSIALFDSVIPAVPSETTVILGGIAAGQGELFIVLVIAAAAMGAFLGDNLAYQLGDRAGGWLRNRFFASGKGEKRLIWATGQIESRGGLLLITGRFIPGGRTAITMACGITKQPLDWFVKWDGAAALLWACYAAILGFIFGEKFKDDHTTAFVWAFSAALSVTALIEIVRWIRKRREPSH
jgi:membrane protein DedA with SNARE-associated domain